MEPCGAPSHTLRPIRGVAKDPTTCLLQKPYIKKLLFKDIMV